MEPNQTSSIEGGSIPQTQKPDTSFTQDVSLIKGLQADLPKYQGINPYALKRRLIEDDDFYNQFTDDIISFTDTIDRQRLREQDPDQYEMMNATFRKNFRKDLVRSSYVGETIRDTLIDRTTLLRTNMDELPIDAYFSTVQKNLDNYKAFDLVANNEFIYTDDRDDKLTFTQKVKNNPELHRQIINDRYNEYLTALGHSHNNPALLDDIVKKTTGYVIFENFGGEGLTQYINRLQQDSAKTVDEALDARQSQTDFFAQARVDGKNVSEIIDEFINENEEKGISTLTFQPIEPKQDLTVNVPPDLNEFTLATGLYSFVDDNFIKNDHDEGFADFLKKMAPDDYKKFLNYDNIKEQGEYASEYRQLIASVYEWAYETDSMEALMDTVKQAGVYSEGGYGVDGEPVYRINYDEAEPHVRLALNALQMDDEGNYMTTYVDDNTWDFRPKRMETSMRKFETPKNLLFATTTELYSDEEGNLQRRIVTDNSGLWGVWNTAATVALGVLDFGNRFLVEPIIRTAGEVTGSEGIKRYAERYRDLVGVDMSTGLSREADGLLPNAIGEIAPFVQYMGGMYMIGKRLLLGGASVLSGATKLKSAIDFQRYAGHMKGATRTQAIAMRLNKAAAEKTPWLMGTNFYVGGMAIEATQPRDMSFHNTIPQLFGYEPTNDWTMFYKTSNKLTQTGMDIAGSFVLDGFFDTLISGTKFLTASAGKRYFARTEFKGLNYNPDKFGKKFGGFEVVDAPQFRHEMREFWTNLTRELDTLPIGSIGETMAKGVLKGTKHSSLHDFTKMFVDDSELFFTNIKKDIEDQILYYKRHLGDGLGDLKPEDLKRMVDEQYNYFLNNVTDQIYGTLRTGSDELPLRFAQTLDEQVPTVKLFKPNGKKINPEDMGNHKGVHLVRKGNDVYEVNPKFWTVDLAHRLRTKAVKDTKESVLARKQKELPKDYTQEQYNQLKSEVDTYIGTPVKVGGKIGHVVDFDGSGTFTVRTSDGGSVKTKMATELSDEDVNQMVINLTNKGVGRQKLLGAGAPPAQRELDILKQIDDIDTRLAQQTAEIEGRINDLSRRHSAYDDIISDDNTYQNMTPQQMKDARKLRGVQRRAITKEITDLQARKDQVTESLAQQKKETQRRLSELHRDNPELQADRPDVIPSGISPEVAERNRLMANLFGDPEIDVGQRLTLKGGKTPRMVTHRNTSKELTKYVKAITENNIDNAVNGKYRLRLDETSKTLKKVVDKQLDLPFC